MYDLDWSRIALFCFVTTVCGYGSAQDPEQPSRFDSPFKRSDLPPDLRPSHGDELPDLDIPNLEDPLPGQEEKRRRLSGERLQPLRLRVEATRQGFEATFPKLFTPEVKKLLEENDTDPELRRLMKQRCHAAIGECLARFAQYRNGQSHLDGVLASSQRVASSLLSLDPARPTRLLILQHVVDAAKELEKYAKQLCESGMGTIQEVYRAEYFRLSAEIKLLSETESKIANQPKE